MRKRIIALLLALILTVGLLPTVALAAEGDAGQRRRPKRRHWHRQINTISLMVVRLQIKMLPISRCPRRLLITKTAPIPSR